MSSKPVFPCGWPNLPRYERPDGMAFGRHMGTVWPQIQGFWAEAAARAGRADLFGHELFNLATHAVRDKHFAEIYHPLTGKPYGGLQESLGQGIVLWQATSRQTWAATAYLRMVLLGLVGLRFETRGVRFQPCIPKGLALVRLQNLRYRAMTLDVTIRGTGTRVCQCRINGKDRPEAFLAADSRGPHEVYILVSE